MRGFYDVCVRAHFSAAHFLRGYQGNCARLHGHNWDVEVFVRCEKLDELGIAVDFRDVKSAFKGILEDFDHKNLNDLPMFSDQNPSSENMARILYKLLGKKLNAEKVRVSKIRVSETPDTAVFYWED